MSSVYRTNSSTSALIVLHTVEVKWSRLFLSFFRGLHRFILCHCRQYGLVKSDSFIIIYTRKIIGLSVIISNIIAAVISSFVLITIHLNMFRIRNFHCFCFMLLLTQISISQVWLGSRTIGPGLHKVSNILTRAWSSHSRWYRSIRKPRICRARRGLLCIKGIS